MMFGLDDDNSSILKFKVSKNTDDVRDDIACRFINSEGNLCLITTDEADNIDGSLTGKIIRVGEHYILNDFYEQFRQCAEFILNKKHMEKSFRETIKDDSLIHAPVTHEDIKEWKEAYFDELKKNCQMHRNKI